MNKKLSGFLKIIFFLSIGFLLLWLVSKNLTANQKKVLINSLKEANYLYILLSISFGLLSHFIRALRWKNMIATLGLKVKTSNSFFAVMIGYLVNIAIFRMGEIARCGFMARYEKAPADQLFGTVITERVIDLIMLILVFALTILTQYDKLIQYYNDTIYSAFKEKLSGLANLITIGFILLVFAALAFYLLKRFKVFDKLKGFILGLKEGILSVRNIENIPLFIFHSVLIWFFYFMMVYVAFDCLPETADLGFKAGMAILAFGSLGIIVVQGGIGAYHIIVQQICILYGVGEAVGLGFAWIIWSAQTILILLGGFISFLLMPFINKKTEYGIFEKN